MGSTGGHGEHWFVAPKRGDKITIYDGRTVRTHLVVETDGGQLETELLEERTHDLPVGMTGAVDIPEKYAPVVAAVLLNLVRSKDYAIIDEYGSEQAPVIGYDAERYLRDFPIERIGAADA